MPISGILTNSEDLRKLSLYNLFSEEGDYILKYKNAADGQVTLNFNMCSNTYHQCHLKNESYFGFDQDFANIVLPNGQCHRLTPDDMDDGSAALIDKGNPEYGLRLKFTSNEICNGTQKYGLIVDIRCQDDAFDAIPRLQSDSIKSNSCTPKIYFDSDAGTNSLLIKYRLRGQIFQPCMVLLLSHSYANRSFTPRYRTFLHFPGE